VEQAVLGMVMVDPGCGDALIERGVTGDWFYEGIHQKAWTLIEAAIRGGQGMDPLLLARRLVEQAGMDEAQATVFCAGLGEKVVSSALLPTYLGQLEEHYKRRQILRVGYKLKAALGEEGATADVVIDGAVRELESLREHGGVEKEKPVPHYLGQVLEKMEEYHRGPSQVRGLRTGVEAWDKYLSGLGDGCGYYHVLAGRPSSGKTSLALQVAMEAAIVQKVPVLVVSMEMNGVSCVQRMLFMRARADLQRWRTGYGRVAANNEYERMAAAAAEIQGAKMFLDETGGLSIEELIARVKRVHRQEGIGLVVLDYIQLLRTSRPGWRPDRVQELTGISAEIRRCANRLRLPWLVLAQMNRDIEKEVSRIPRLSDLKDCGAIEQDADTVSFIYRPALSSESKQQEVEETLLAWTHETERNSGGVVWAKPEYAAILVAKQRFGPCGRAEVLFDKASTYFEDYQVVRRRLGLKDTKRRHVREDEEPVLVEDELPM
jgi:replicative DNA helicase